MLQGTSKQFPDLYASVNSGPVLQHVDDDRNRNDSPKSGHTASEEFGGQPWIGDVRRLWVLSVSVHPTNYTFLMAFFYFCGCIWVDSPYLVSIYHLRSTADSGTVRNTSTVCLYECCGGVQQWRGWMLTAHQTATL